MNGLKPYRVECGQCRLILLRGEFPRAPVTSQWRCPACRKMVTVEVVEETPPGSWDSKKAAVRE